MENGEEMRQKWSKTGAELGQKPQLRRRLISAVKPLITPNSICRNYSLFADMGKRKSRIRTDYTVVLPAFVSESN